MELYPLGPALLPSIGSLSPGSLLYALALGSMSLS